METINSYSRILISMIAGAVALYFLQILSIAPTLITDSKAQELAQISYNQGYEDAAMPFNKDGSKKGVRK